MAMVELERHTRTAEGLTGGGPGSDPVTALGRLRAAVGTIFRGDAVAVDLLVTAYLAGGHVLIEDSPGVGKTTLGRALALATGGVFRRLQCTPDLMPADITGISIYDERERSFTFHPGPVFCDVLLADELNRTPPRTQSALLEVLSEGRVTVDGEARELADGFFCVATQNPIESVGTYPLPDSQRDRFLMRFGVGYPDRNREAELLAADGAESELARLRPVLSPDLARTLRAAARNVTVEDSVRNYLLDLVAATRSARGLDIGASPRAALGLQRAAQARALLEGRGFVVPDDVQRLATVCLAHRVVVRTGHVAEEILAAIVESIAVPR